MINTSWLKIVPYLAAAGAIWWTLDSVYTQAQEFEIAKCESKQAKADMDAINKLEKLREELEAERDKADRRATQIIGAYANEIEKLHNDLSDATDHRLYITAKAPACEADRNAMSSADKSAGAPAQEVRFELSKDVSRAFRRDYISGMMLVKKEHALIDLIKAKPDCFEVVK